MRRVRAWVGLPLAVLIGLAGAVLGGSDAPALAAQPAALVDVSLIGVSPELPSRDDTVTLAGRVTNVTDRPLVRLQVLFWRSQSPITDVDGLEQALYSALMSHSGGGCSESRAPTRTSTPPTLQLWRLAPPRRSP